MAYVTLYLRWRPQDFESLVGQQPIKQALSNALTTGRIAHAYLFTGPRGTGKTTTARIFAKALNCEHGPTATPCGKCGNCVQITEGTSMDVQELDAASNRGVEDIKNLNKNADFAPVNCRYKVYIIDEAHMLTTEACNALLKTLEEPPAHVVFILATTEPQKILPTIHSRCQRFDFHPLTQAEIVDHLRKVAAGSDIKVDDEALQLIAAASEGGMRDALSLLEQCGVMAEQVTGETVRSVRGIVGREILRQLMTAVGQSQPAAALEIFAKLLEQGKDIAQILLEIEEYLRSLLLFQAAPDYQQIYVTDTAAAFKQLVPFFPPERILAAQEVLHQALGELRFLSRGRIVAEMCLCDLCKVQGDSLLALKARVAQLERALAGRGPLLQMAAPEVAVPDVMAEPKVITPQVPAKPKVVAPKIAAGPKVVVQPVTEKAKAVPPQAVPAPQVVTPKIAAEPKFTPAPKVTGLKVAVPQAVAPQPVQAYSGDWAMGDEYWKQARELLKGEGKMSMFACALTASVLSLEGNVLTLGFKNKFTCDRMQQPDYRASFEDALLRVSRKTIKLSCVLETDKPAAPKKKVTSKTEVVPEEAMGKTARRAMAFFGGTLQWAEGKTPESK
jgi:DNA polymerase-3 subunit gamma/tau